MLPGMDGSCVVQILHNVHIIAAGRLGSTAADDLCAHHTILYHTKRHHSKNRLEVAAAASRLFFFLFLFRRSCCTKSHLVRVAVAISSVRGCILSVCGCIGLQLQPAAAGSSMRTGGIRAHPFFFLPLCIMRRCVCHHRGSLLCIYDANIVYT